MMKEDWTPIDFGQTEDTTKNIIKVIGVGGGGCNAVKNMYADLEVERYGDDARKEWFGGRGKSRSGKK